MSKTPEPEHLLPDDTLGWMDQPPMGYASAPTSVTKGQALVRGLRPLSPSLLEERLVDHAEGTPSLSTRRSQGMGLANSWTFWIDTWERKPGDVRPVQQLEEVKTIRTIKDFWNCFNNLELSNIHVGCSLHLFKCGIRPTWEDDQNIGGGHFKMVVKDPELRGKVWLDLSLALVGEHFHYSDCVCGAGVTIKEYGSAISLWIRTRDPALRDMVQHQLVKLVGENTKIVFKANHTKLEETSGERRLSLTSALPPTPSHGVPSAADPRLRDNVEAARCCGHRRTSSAPSPKRRNSLISDDMLGSLLDLPTTTTFAALPPISQAYARLRHGMDSRLPMTPESVPSVPTPVHPELISPALMPSSTQSRKAIRAGVKCLNPTLVNAHGTSIPAAATTSPASERSFFPLFSSVTPSSVPARGRSEVPVRAKRSLSDSHRTLYIPTGPLLSRRSQRNCSGGALSPSGTTPSVTPRRDAHRGSAANTPMVSPTKHKQMVEEPVPPSVPPSTTFSGPSPVKVWADTPWTPDSPYAIKGSRSPQKAPPAYPVSHKGGVADSTWRMWAKRRNEEERPTSEPRDHRHDDREHEKPPLGRGKGDKGFRGEYERERHWESERLDDRRGGGGRGRDRGDRREYERFEYDRDRRRDEWERNRGHGRGEPPHHPRKVSPPPDDRDRRREGGRGREVTMEDDGRIRPKAYGQGKSSSSAFIHKGYLYPPGLNRKQRRTIIFGSEEKKEEVAEGTWLGLDYDDGIVTDEELILLKRGIEVPRLYKKEAEREDRDVVPPEERSPRETVSPPGDSRPITPPPGIGSPPDLGPPISQIPVHQLAHVMRTPPLQPSPCMYPTNTTPIIQSMVLPSRSSPPPMIFEAPSSSESIPPPTSSPSEPRGKLNPDAAAFVPKRISTSEPHMEPPALLNGVPTYSTGGSMANVMVKSPASAALSTPPTLVLEQQSPCPPMLVASAPPPMPGNMLPMHGPPSLQAGPGFQAIVAPVGMAGFPQQMAIDPSMGFQIVRAGRGPEPQYGHAGWPSPHQLQRAVLKHEM